MAWTYRGWSKPRGRCPVPHACYFVHEAALALHHAHQQGLVHRDIKPSNLMLSHEGHHAVIKLLDFGTARTGSDGSLIDLEPAPSNGQGTGRKSHPRRSDPRYPRLYGSGTN